MKKNRNLLCVLSILIFVFSNAVAKNELEKSAIAVLGDTDPVVTPPFQTNFEYTKDGDGEQTTNPMPMVSWFYKF